MLKDGKVEAEGGLEQLVTDYEEMRHLWGSEPAVQVARALPSAIGTLLQNAEA